MLHILILRTLINTRVEQSQFQLFKTFNLESPFIIPREMRRQKRKERGRKINTLRNKEKRSEHPHIYSKIKGKIISVHTVTYKPIKRGADKIEKE